MHISLWPMGLGASSSETNMYLYMGSMTICAPRSKRCATCIGMS
jgi:hypothetical protein